MARTDKRQIQIKNRKRHLASLKSKIKKTDLGQRIEPNIERKQAYIDIKKTFLIVCEGENTEPSYFNGFKIKSASIKVLGHGYNTVTLVEKTKMIVEEEAKKENYYDEVWCVFDKDEFPNEDYNKAITIAANYGFKTAYSNQSFEYWLLLHFNDHQGGSLNRKVCCEKLNELLKPYGLVYDYKKTKKIEKDFFDLMLSMENESDEKRRIDTAIVRADKIDRKLDNKNPALEESSTKVYLLVNKIIGYM